MMDALGKVLTEQVKRAATRVHVESLPTQVEAAVKAADGLVAEFLPKLKKVKDALKAVANAPELVGDQKEGLEVLLDQLEVGMQALTQVETTVVDLSGDAGVEPEDEPDEDEPTASGDDGEDDQIAPEDGGAAAWDAIKKKMDAGKA
jgi:hypothetical protein